MRSQHHPACLGYLPGRTPWRPFACKTCDAIDREQARAKAAWERATDTVIHQHGKGENP